ncbi:nitrous oxidase accessory protein [Anoxybacillus vitaminiphilus]|uniref:Nitrous oxidase accessory protein n=1 Tax=Paranoxybacillus vitaminiphilus TaxID=581036 RepID=A0A327YD57_9BACL|nr:nitrous oxide reductase family maturation protein NosD [Anoxybacillus vitaminiphilus]RAK18397.1 nitrous oxidase accessory protein [Anoxybacillus vitaminiphilus]
MKNMWFSTCVIALGTCLFLLNTPTYAETYKVEKGMSIQQTINKAKDGSTILVSPGIYKENLTITKTLTVIGENGAVVDGGKQKNVITVTAPNVTIKGLTIQHSGNIENNAGVFLDHTTNSVIEMNRIKNVKYGIYVEKGKGHQIHNNQISSFPIHFSRRGNGIHLFYTEDIAIKDNTIQNIQDGIYFDHSKKQHISKNSITQSRYGMHFMFSQAAAVAQNHLSSNMTGLMVMESSGLQFKNNEVKKHLDYRGYGALIYHSSSVDVTNNEFISNHTGFALEETENVSIKNNLIAGNYIGIQMTGKNQHSVISANNVVGNLVQFQPGQNSVKLDDGQYGNYWDDYSSYDLTNDGIGEIPYEPYTIYKNVKREVTYLPFFFESPAMKLWSATEKILPSIRKSDNIDRFPKITPFSGQKVANNNDGNKNVYVVMISVLLCITSFFILRIGKVTTK